MLQLDGVLHVLAEPAKGQEALNQLHNSMIDPVKGPVVDLQHFLDRIFVMPGGTDTKAEVCFTGTLTNVLVNGQRITTDFATWVTMSKSESEDALRAEYLRVFSDTSVLMRGIVTVLTQG